MPLNPIDVQQKTFGTALRGYDLDEVDDFLDSVVTALKDYESQLVESRDRVAELERQLAERGDSEGAIARALVAAQRSADMIIEEARVQATETAAAAKTEAAKTIEDARGEASQLTATREAEEDALRVEIASIQQRASQMRVKVKALLEDVAAELESASEKIVEVEAVTGERAEGMLDESGEEIDEVEAADDETAGDEDEDVEAVIHEENDEAEESESPEVAEDSESPEEEADEAFEEVESSMRPWERG